MPTAYGYYTPLERWPDLKVGDILNAWYDTGAFGAQLVYYKVLKICPKKVYVATENHGNHYMFTNHFNEKMPADLVRRELLDELYEPVGNRKRSA